ncbi:hypothetical protein NDU88_002696 [Pleurodeles waltl]|uniref:Uncharacterized protein n=1 Tax=Pleurodeles waltl TaxID=8319 RepID=A0AAV7T351_PLEWA|nr:hypothetical protein NDU88_002696 [Pleurodeles waltl]
MEEVLTRKSFGREPIWLAFQVMAGRNRHFAPSPGKEDEEAETEGVRMVREKAEALERTEKKAVEDPRTERKAGEASAAIIAVEEWGGHRNPAAPQNTAEDQEALHQNSRPRSGKSMASAGVWGRT